MLRRALNGLAAGVVSLAVTASVVGVQGTPASATPSASTSAAPALDTPVTPIAGIPQPCAVTHAWPQGARQADIVAALSHNTGFQLTGPDWAKPSYLPMVKIIWQTLDGLSCTDYVRHVTLLHPGFSLNAAPISGYAWGDWGLTKPGATTLDFAKWAQALKANDPGRLVRILVHELGHAWDSDREGAPYWSAYAALDKKLGAISDYGRRSPDENFSEVVGYYVARCAASNPYDNKKFAPYYAFVQQNVFGGRQFGGAPGTKATCSAPVAMATPVVRPHLITAGGR